MLSYAPAVNAYKKSEINTCSPIDLIIMLYEGALLQIRRARTALQDGDVKKRVESINRAIAIIEELLRSLNFEEGGSIAENLQQLYLYVMKELTEFNLTISEDRLKTVETVLSTLLEGWKELKEQIE